MNQLKQKLTLAGVAHTFLINLEHRTDRYQESRHALEASLGLSIEDESRVTVIRPRHFEDSEGFINAGYKSCLHAHIDCASQAESRFESDTFLVLEDDFEFPANWDEVEHEILAELENLDWDIATLGYEELVAGPQAFPIEDGHWQRFDGRLRGSHAYLVHRRALPRWIAHLETIAYGQPGDHVLGPMGPDAAMNTLTWVDERFKRYMLKSNAVGQRTSPSDCNPSRLQQIPIARAVHSSQIALKARRALKQLLGSKR